MLHAFQSVLGEELSLTCRERGCKTLEMAVETVEILERHTKNGPDGPEVLLIEIKEY